MKKIQEDKKKFIEKRKAEKEAQQKKMKDDLLKGAPHHDDVPLKPGGGEPEDLESIKRRNFIKQVRTKISNNYQCYFWHFFKALFDSELVILKQPVVSSFPPMLSLCCLSK